MANQFETHVNNQFKFNFSEKEVLQQDIIKITADKYHLITNNQSQQIQIIHKDLNQKTYHIKVNSNLYKVRISSPLDILIQDLGLSAEKIKQVNDIKAPMPGLILEINVTEGQQIKQGDSILVLEAMKMENNITATNDAIIKTIAVKKGQTVSKNELLIELE